MKRAQFLYASSQVPSGFLGNFMPEKCSGFAPNDPSIQFYRERNATLLKGLRLTPLSTFPKFVDNDFAGSIATAVRPGSEPGSKN